MSRSPRRLLGALLATTVVLSLVLCVCGWLLLRQQAEIEDRRARSALEGYADATAAAVRSRLADTGDQLSAWLSSPSAAPPTIDNAAALLIEGRRPRRRDGPAVCTGGAAGRTGRDAPLRGRRGGRASRTKSRPRRLVEPRAGRARRSSRSCRRPVPAGSSPQEVARLRASGGRVRRSPRDGDDIDTAGGPETEQPGPGRRAPAGSGTIVRSGQPQSNRYPSPRTLFRNRGADGDGSISCRKCAIWLSTTRSVIAVS